MVENLEDRVEGDLLTFKPSDSRTQFMIMTDDCAVMVDAADHSFKPLDRGSSTDYLRVKNFLKEVGLDYRAV